MPTFADQLERASAAWVAEGLLTAEQRAAILARPASPSESRVVPLLAGVGAAVVALGLVLVVAANWAEIPRAGKFGLVVAAMLALDLAGYRLSFGRSPRVRTGEALLLAGAAAFLGALALVTQQYHIDADASAVLLVWLLSLVPRPYLLSSRSFAALTPVAALAWLATEAVRESSPLGVDDDGALWLLALGAGAAVLAVGALHRGTRWAFLAPPVEAVGAATVAISLLTLGFYRHLGVGEGLPPAAIAVLVAAIALVVGAMARRPWPAAGRDAPLAAAGVVIAALALAVVTGLTAVDGRGAQVVTVGFWILTVALVVAVVRLGLRAGRPPLVNGALVLLGVFILCRWFDLFPEGGDTGLLFLGAGAVLLVTSFVLERSRRALGTGGQPGAAG